MDGALFLKAVKNVLCNMNSLRLELFSKTFYNTEGRRFEYRHGEKQKNNPI